jgi:hypothetical protein
MEEIGAASAGETTTAGEEEGDLSAVDTIQLSDAARERRRGGQRERVARDRVRARRGAPS